jgi:hypothetical protein
MAEVSAIARAVLYEGYLLWPYRRSAPKNRQRWTFGGVFAPAWNARHDDDARELEAQVLVEGAGDATVAVTLRFLHVVDRRVGRRAGSGLHWVDELVVDGERHLTWEEATERELAVAPERLDALAGGLRAALAIPAGRDVEPLADAGAIVREWEGIDGALDVRAEALEPGLWRLTVRFVNDTPGECADRPAALRRATVSTHLVLEAGGGGAFVSSIDPPAELAAAAAACHNVGTWPSLAGEEGERHTMLCTPIIVGDHPRIAPESPGDLFDSGEIDRLLILNTLSLTPEEQREMRDSDPRAREILERCAALSPEQLTQLDMGAIREFRTLREA